MHENAVIYTVVSDVHECLKACIYKPLGNKSVQVLLGYNRELGS